MTALPWTALAGGLCFAVAVELWNRRRPARPDSGTLWVVVVWRFGIPFGGLLAFSTGVESVAPELWWNRGYHLFADRTGLAGLPPGDIYPWAVILPFVVWAMLVIWECVGEPRSRDAGRSLSGSAGLGPSRAWILWAAVPFAAVAAGSMARLGGGSEAYPAALWSYSVVFVLSLVGVGLSRGPLDSISARVSEAPAEDPRPADWQASMIARGLSLQTLGRSEPDPVAGLGVAGSDDRASGSAGGSRGARLARRGVSPELVAALERLVDPMGDPCRRRALIIGPDGVGQGEGTADLAALLYRRYSETTLVVTARRSDLLAERLKPWLDGVSVAVPTAAEPLPDAAVRVTDAETLSDAVLPRLRAASHVLDNLGLVVWWDLHRFSGVYGANLWALSRRLQRLLRRGSAGEARTLAFLRSADAAGAQLPDFVRRVLPQDFSGCETYLPSRPAKRLHLYALGPQEDHFSRGLSSDIAEQFRHPALVAARESTRLGWRTHLEVPAEVPRGTIDAVGELPAGAGSLRRALRASPADAEASIRALAAGDALSLMDRFAGSGRAHDQRDHHLALSLPINPYARHLVERLDDRLRPRADRDYIGTARRLICAAGDDRLMRRHLLSALSERPDTHKGLQRDFLRDDTAIREVLGGLAAGDTLTRQEVRSLDERGRLIIDYRYSSRESADDRHHPLDTVGSRLLQVVDPAAGHGSGAGIRLRLDPERAGIVAYPGRIFSSHGRRYQIDPWPSGSFEAPEGHPGALTCRSIDGHALTWRRRFHAVRRPQRNASHLSVAQSRGGELILQRAQGLKYEETVLGYYRLQIHSLSAGAEDLQRVDYEQPLFVEMETRGLLLLLPRAVTRIALVSLCAALRPVLDVHLGVEENVIETVPIHGLVQADDPTARPLYGVALVELYPGGIGILDVLHDADRLIPDLLIRAQRWIDGCPCGDEGCERCVRSVESLAASGQERPRRDEALRILEHMTGAQ